MTDGGNNIRRLFINNDLGDVRRLLERDFALTREKKMVEKKVATKLVEVCEC